VTDQNIDRPAISAAHIVVPQTSPTPPAPKVYVIVEQAPESNVDAIFRNLRAIRSETRFRVADREVLPRLISVCVRRGFNRWGQIVGALKSIGYKQAKIRVVLDDLTGSDPAIHRWERDEDGIYRLLK
jgi:hypothetical protein